MPKSSGSLDYNNKEFLQSIVEVWCKEFSATRHTMLLQSVLAAYLVP